MIHKATYSVPGSFFAEETTRTLERRTVFAALEAAPTGAFCFVLYDVEEAPDLGPEFRVVPVAKNKSGRYYIGGTLYTIEQLEYRMAATGEDFKILASNMRGNRWDHVIQCGAEPTSRRLNPVPMTILSLSTNQTCWTMRSRNGLKLGCLGTTVTST